MAGQSQETAQAKDTSGNSHLYYGFRHSSHLAAKQLPKMETEKLQHQSSKCLTEPESHQQLNQNHREGKGSSE